MSATPPLSLEAKLVLAILGPNRELSGLEIVNRSGGMLQKGLVYVLLSQMEDVKLITSRLEDTRPGAHPQLLPRRLYRSAAR
jgi:DNA-binding PadR family transcriptional regulator